MDMNHEHVDVLIVGAGLSGIGAAHHLQERCPSKSFTLLEARGAIGGTWDLHRYPGIRSDSDMYTFGYRFRPWKSDKSLADGPAILRYIEETAREAGIDRKIRFHHRVERAEWSSVDNRWTVGVTRSDTGERMTLTASFLYNCSGYYRYEEGYTPDFPGMERFKGPIIHPQHWPESLDYQGKRVVVIGSGATAVTLVPAMAEGGAAHVTMLQRSPTYMANVPGRDAIASALRKWLPERTAYALTRWKNVLRTLLIYELSQRRPDKMKRFLLGRLREQLPDGFDIGTHFEPRYNPWDQRLCAVPDGDLFEAIGRGDVSIVTDTIERFTETGVQLDSGDTIEADIIVTATGFNLQMMGGAELLVDGEPVRLADTMTYKGMMLSDVPNSAFTIGYTNSSWTLKADLVSEYVCRLLNYMDEQGYAVQVPRGDPAVERSPLLDFGAGYVRRSLDKLPRQGAVWPWKLRMSYPIDVLSLRYGPVDDGVMEFRRTTEPRPAERAGEEAALRT